MSSLEHAIAQLYVQNDGQIAYDTSLIVGDEQIKCHRALLQTRSSALRDIFASHTSSNANKDQILEIHLPDNLDAQTMRSIVQFCYTNTISTENIATQQLAGNLMLAARQFKLDPLYEMCKQILAAIVEDQDQLPESMKGKVLSVPNSSLNLTSLFDDEQTSDVALKTASGAIHAHKCILLSQVPSLSEVMKDDIIDVSEISHESVKRAMLFLYTGKVAAVTQQDVLEDLLTAKELHLNDLMNKLERAINISDTNALDILKLAVQHDFVRLKQAALDRLAHNDYDSIFQSIKCLEKHCSTIASEFDAVVRVTEEGRTRQTPNLIGGGITLRGSLGLIVATVTSMLLLRVQIENEFIVAFINVSFCYVVVAFFL